ncbi:hypothetical protein HNR10_004186 [Nocardiopsis aegyptia]|uniref:Uncharacterized protein n=1 Tax=Nocardiopsis aegyptia TaxID=220378 RepID=A0A7Z0EQB4_9ACTN|nr:hypothetical protein [Nocardiopsis aegyptia]
MRRTALAAVAALRESAVRLLGAQAAEPRSRQ